MFAIFGFLRVGELTSKSLKSRDLKPLQFGDIAIFEDNWCKHVKVTIKQSKTDQFVNIWTIQIKSIYVLDLLDLRDKAILYSDNEEKT